MTFSHWANSCRDWQKFTATQGGRSTKRFSVSQFFFWFLLISRKKCGIGELNFSPSRSELLHLYRLLAIKSTENRMPMLNQQVGKGSLNFYWWLPQGKIIQYACIPYSANFRNDSKLGIPTAPTPFSPWIWSSVAISWIFLSVKNIRE